MENPANEQCNDRTPFKDNLQQLPRTGEAGAGREVVCHLARASGQHHPRADGRVRAWRRRRRDRLKAIPSSHRNGACCAIGRSERFAMRVAGAVDETNDADALEGQQWSVDSHRQTSKNERPASPKSPLTKPTGWRCLLPGLWPGRSGGRGRRGSSWPGDEEMKRPEQMLNLKRPKTVYRDRNEKCD